MRECITDGSRGRWNGHRRELVWPMQLEVNVDVGQSVESINEMGRDRVIEIRGKAVEQWEASGL